MSSDSNYEKLSDELQNKINTELFDGNGFKDNAIRRIDKEHDRATLWRPAFVRDVEKNYAQSVLQPLCRQNTGIFFL